MVGVKIQGRLGNQMFQVAFASVLAKKLRTDYFIWHKPWKEVSVLKYFNIPGLNYFSFCLRLIKGYFLNLTGVLKPVEISNYATPESQFHLLENDKYYHGFFQSESYYSGEEEFVQNLFSVKEEYVRLYEREMGTLMSSNKTIVLHIRRGDYLTLDGENASLPVSYYKKCLAQIPMPDQYTIVFVSDDINWVQDQFAEIPNAVFCSNHLMVDLQVLMHADIVVLANSSFSWWGAYLNKKNAIVYAPLHWLGSNKKESYPIGILCKNWIAIDTN